MSEQQLREKLLNMNKEVLVSLYLQKHFDFNIEKSNLLSCNCDLQNENKLLKIRISKLLKDMSDLQLKTTLQVDALTKELGKERQRLALLKLHMI